MSSVGIPQEPKDATEADSVAAFGGDGDNDTERRVLWTQYERCVDGSKILKVYLIDHRYRYSHVLVSSNLFLGLQRWTLVYTLAYRESAHRRSGGGKKCNFGNKQDAPSQS